MLIRNFALLAHHDAAGHGGLGEGMAMQIAPDGRRILWCAHEGPPKNFTAFDVSNPRALRIVVQTNLPHANMRSNSLEITGNLMAVAYQVDKPGRQPAGFELFDISVPEEPRAVSFFDASGPDSRGVHQLWFCDGAFVHLSSGAPDWQPRHPRDDQFYRIVDVRDPVRPVEVGRWWLPGTRDGDAEPPPPRHPAAFDNCFRVHNTNVYPERPDRAWLGYLDAGMIVLDISDMGNPRPIARWDNSPPFWGFTHTVLPLFDRDLLVVTDESIRDDGQDWPKHVWMVDYRCETNPVPIATCPTPDFDAFAHRGGRFGAHNIHENQPGPASFRSSEVIFATWFGGGLRAYDIADAYAPREIAHFVPDAPPLAPTGNIQLNDVFVDERGIVYVGDRHVGGLYALECTF